MIKEIYYGTIVKSLFTLVIKGYDTERIHEIDDGDWQGNYIYLIPKDTYQPLGSDYLVTQVSYGSCSGCDTIEGIRQYDSGLPNEEQIKEYMTLALHLVQQNEVSIYDR